MLASRIASHAGGVVRSLRRTFANGPQRTRAALYRTCPRAEPPGPVVAASERRTRGAGSHRLVRFRLQRRGQGDYLHAAARHRPWSADDDQWTCDDRASRSAEPAGRRSVSLAPTRVAAARTAAAAKACDSARCDKRRRCAMSVDRSDSIACRVPDGKQAAVDRGPAQALPRGGGSLGRSGQGHAQGKSWSRASSVGMTLTF